MLSRALSLATVLLLVGWFAPALAQENLDAGKTPSQLFAGTCNACHKSPRGLLKTVSPSSLPGFLRQHYTTSPNMAGLLASYLVSNGATDTRYGEAPKGAKGAKEGAKEGTKQEAKQEPRPEQLDRQGRPIHRTPPQEANAPAAEPKPEGEPAQAAVDPGAAKNAKQKLSKRGRPGEALPKEEPAKPSEAAAREEAKPDAPRPADEGRSQSAKVEQPAETPALRPDPVPPVTPAPTGSSAPAMAAAPATTPAASSPPADAAPPAQTVLAVPPTEMAVPLPANALPPPPPPAVTASSAPPPPPVAPAGPPAPPISQ